jgi:tetratricopeptide (TPR) repeat protein
MDSGSEHQGKSVPGPSLHPTRRYFRVFVCSTFRDMHDERDELVKYVFPRLHEICRKRGVILTEIDLRWGITDEERAEGRVLPICLGEIRKPNTCFLALLGERYGWIPRKEGVPRGLLKTQPWLKKHLTHSVTEMEILHGVFKDRDRICHPYFYLRDPACLQSATPEKMENSLEGPTDEDIADLGCAKAVRRAAERRRRLAGLKRRIRREALRGGSRLVLRDGYANPGELAQSVLADLTELINRLFPEAAVIEAWQEDNRRHEDYALGLREVYIDRPEYYTRLDDLAGAIGPAGKSAVVTGEPGAGKSALLANWAAHRKERYPGEHMFTHFVGASGASPDWAGMLIRIMRETKRLLGIAADVPTDRGGLKLAFANWLHMAASEGRVTVVIDGVNQLEDRDGALELAWLPAEIPDQVRFVLSTASDSQLGNLRSRGWNAVNVEPLQPSERRKLLSTYLRQYGKSLREELTEIVVKREQTSNPLYLRSLLDQLRFLGKREELAAVTDRYLEADTVPELYQRILARCEADYDRDRPGLVRDALSLLWAARRGMSESELRDALGSKEKAMFGAYWSPLRYGLGQALFERSGLVGFSHDSFRQVVRQRYLEGQDRQDTARRRVASYFATCEESDRKADELPWQLSMLGSWEELAGVLAEVPLLDRAWRLNRNEVKEYWAAIESRTAIRKADCYQRVIVAPGDGSDRTAPTKLVSLALLLRETGSLDESLALWQYLEKCFVARSREDHGAHKYLAKSLNNQAAVLIETGKLELALALCRKAEAVCRDIGDPDELLRVLVNTAAIHQLSKRFKEALAAYEEAKSICRRTGNLEGIAVSLGNQVAIYLEAGDPDKAEKLACEQEQVANQMVNKNALRQILGTRVSILEAKEDYAAALEKTRRQVALCRTLGDKQSLQNALGNAAHLLITLRELDEATAVLDEQEGLCVALKSREGLARCYDHRGVVLRLRGRFADAVAMHENAEGLHRGAEAQTAGAAGSKSVLGPVGSAGPERPAGPDFDGLQFCLRSKGRAYLALQEHGRAMACFEEMDAIGRKTRNDFVRQDALGWQGKALESEGNFTEALERLGLRYQMCAELALEQGPARALKARRAMALALMEQAKVLATGMQRPADAVAKLEDAERIAREAGLASLEAQIGGLIDGIGRLPGSGN